MLRGLIKYTAAPTFGRGPPQNKQFSNKFFPVVLDIDRGKREQVKPIGDILWILWMFYGSHRVHRIYSYLVLSLGNSTLNGTLVISWYLVLSVCVCCIECQSMKLVVPF